MRSKSQLLLLLCIASVTTHAQIDKVPSLNVGDPAPALRVREWLKGTPVQRFEKGKVYVLEFWATWCAPCKAAMPHLSVLARQYKDKVSILGIDVKEKKTIEKVKAFVDSMGQQLDYNVATEDGNLMVAAWLEPLRDQGIPKSFVVDQEGRLAWIGHPKHLGEVLSKVVSNTWNIKEASAKWKMDKQLAKLDEDAYYELFNYTGDTRTGVPARPDSAFRFLEEAIKREPKLKYAPRIFSQIFSLLLEKDPHEAYEYGKVAMVTTTYEDPPYYLIFTGIAQHSAERNLPEELYRLGAEAYQAQIDNMPYAETLDMHDLYSNMARLYWRANDKSKAIDTQQKAIEELKSKKGLSAPELGALENELQKYQNR